MLVIGLILAVMAVVAVAVLVAIHIEVRAENRHADEQRDLMIEHLGHIGNVVSATRSHVEKLATEPQLCALTQAALVQLRVVADTHAAEVARKTGTAVARLESREPMSSTGDRVSSTAPPPSTVAEGRSLHPSRAPERAVSRPPVQVPLLAALPKVVPPPRTPVPVPARPPSPEQLRAPLGPHDPTPVSRGHMDADEESQGREPARDQAKR